MNSIQKRIWASISIGLLGIVILTRDIWLGITNTMSITFAIALIAISIIRIVKFQKILKNPRLLKDYIINHEEERFIKIAEKSGRFAFIMTVICELLIITILILTESYWIAQIISIILAIQTLAYVGVYYYLCKKI